MKKLLLLGVWLVAMTLLNNTDQRAWADSAYDDYTQRRDDFVRDLKEYIDEEYAPSQGYGSYEEWKEAMKDRLKKEGHNPSDLRREAKDLQNWILNDILGITNPEIPAEFLGIFGLLLAGVVFWLRKALYRG